MKIFYAITALVCAFLLYQIVDTAFFAPKMNETAPEFIVTSEEADLTVVEFINYNCPYCKEIHPSIAKAVKQDGKIRYLIRPIGDNPDSMLKAAIAYAAGRQNKFAQVQSVIFENTGKVDEQYVTTIIETLALDPEKFNQDFGSSKTKSLIENNIELFLGAGAKATPAFIIGNKTLFIPSQSMPTTQDFLSMFNKVRKIDQTPAQIENQTQ